MTTRPKPYRARTLAGASRRVRRLEVQVRRLRAELGQLIHERRILAKLCADGPAFDNPLWAIQACNLRDRILRTECHLKHDGTPLPAEPAYAAARAGP